MVSSEIAIAARLATNVAQIAAVIVITLGVILAIVSYIRGLVIKQPHVSSVLSGRFVLGHSLSLGLSFLIGASILQSAIAPTWDDIGKLAAIIAIRTILNFFLAKELRELRSEIDG